MAAPVSGAPSHLPKGLTYCSEWTSEADPDELWERATTSVWKGEYSSIHPFTNFWALSESVAADIVRRMVAIAPHLLNRGIGERGQTPLFTVVRFLQSELTKQLLDSRANPNIVAYDCINGPATGYTAFYTALCHCSEPCAKVLLDHGAILYPTNLPSGAQAIWNRLQQERAAQLKALEHSPALSQAQAPTDVLRLVCGFAGLPASRAL